MEVVREPARNTPVFTTCDVLVVGAGPAGCAAAVSAARGGVDTLLMERYGIPGGMSTGGMVVWVDRMSDWNGKQVIAGFANDILDRLPTDAILGPARHLLGSRDPDLVKYWEPRACASNGTVTWAPTVDPEMLKMAYLDLLIAAKVRLLFHTWVVSPVQEGNEIKGVIFESKSGRQAVLAKVVIDATGDGDIFAMAGAPFESDIYEDSIHHQMNVVFAWMGVDMERYLELRAERPNEFRALAAQASTEGVQAWPHVLPYNDVCLFMSPKLPGYNCIDIKDLTEVEIESRRRMMNMLRFYRKNVPGFEKARVMVTAPQVGVRHSRRLLAVTKMVQTEWARGKVFPDEIGVSPPPSPEYPNVSIPFGCLVPGKLEHLLVAGRNLSCDAITHVFMREIPNCWVLGQAAGAAAALAANTAMRVRDVDISALRRELREQGVWLS